MLKFKQGSKLRIATLFLSTGLIAAGAGACKSRYFNKAGTKGNKLDEQFALGVSEQEFDLLKQNGFSKEFAECAAELGALPDFSCGENDLDVTPDKRTPEVVDKPYTRSIEQFVGHVGASHDSNYQVLQNEGDCANPAQLGGGTRCYPNSRVGTLPSFDREGKFIPHVKTGFICRRYHTLPKTPFLVYSDIAVVQTNIKTGRTCFYQFLRTSIEERNPSPFKWENLESLKSSDSAIVAQGIAGLKAGSNFFHPGGSNCTSCHDSDPIIHTRHVESVLVDGKEVGRPILPKINWGLKSNYQLVYSPKSTVSRHIMVKKDPKLNDGRDACTSCHKMGTKTCDHLLSETRFPQYFGDFLDDHKKLSKSRFDTGMAALKACCTQARAGSGTVGSEFTAQTSTNIQVSCQLESLPKTAPVSAPVDTPQVNMD